MPKGEATQEAIEALMIKTADIKVIRDEDIFVIPPFVQSYGENVLGVVLQCLDDAGNEIGRMIAQIRAVRTKQEEDEMTVLPLPPVSVRS